MNCLRKFQRRARQWMAYNQLFLTLYEEHRRYIHVRFTEEAYTKVEAEVDRRTSELDHQLQEAQVCHVKRL